MAQRSWGVLWAGVVLDTFGWTFASLAGGDKPSDRSALFLDDQGEWLLISIF